MKSKLELCYTAIINRLKCLEKGNSMPSYMIPSYIDETGQPEYLDGKPVYTIQTKPGYVDVIVPYFFNILPSLDEHQEYNIAIGVQCTSTQEDWRKVAFSDWYPSYNGSDKVVQAPQEYISTVTWTIMGLVGIPVPIEDKVLDTDAETIPSINEIQNDIQYLLSGWTPTTFSSVLRKESSYSAIPVAGAVRPYSYTAFLSTYKNLLNTRDEFVCLEVPITELDLRIQEVPLEEEL